MDEVPFPDLKIDSSDFLNNVQGRSKCPKCGKSRKWYCYTCYVPLGGPDFEEKIPHVKLPVKIDILKHPQEIDGKSTAVHAAILARDDVTIYTYPTIPQYDPEKVLLVYPGQSAIEFEDYIKNHFPSSSAQKEESPEEPATKRLKAESTQRDCDSAVQNETVQNERKKDSSVKNESETLKQNQSDSTGSVFDRVVFIDATWHTVNKICTDKRLHGLTRIELKKQTTKFWRYQTDKPATYLATIEAIYYFLREYHTYITNRDNDCPYDGQFDNLLFYFCFSYQRIREMYDGGKSLRAYGAEKRTKKKDKNKQT